MIKELSHYENLGSPSFFYYLFKQLSVTNEKWTMKDIQAHFYNKIIDDKFVFDGCTSLAEIIGAIYVDSKGQVRLNDNLKTSLQSFSAFSDKFLEMIILSSKSDVIFQNIFDEENISYDVVYHLIQLDNSCFQFKYSNFRDLLIGFELLLRHPDKKVGEYVINPKYKHLFDKEIMFDIKKRRMGLNAFEKMLNQMEIHGVEAEDFVLQYERKRLSSHQLLKNIERISDYDVAAGYDITSFNSISSDKHDRFIEVKSYSGQPNFHWSRNEIDVARIKKDYYFLYLVDRDKVADTSYIPFIIKNPYKQIMENNSGWDKRVEKYFVTKSG